MKVPLVTETMSLAFEYDELEIGPPGGLQR